jgi:hypothetical protein
MRQCLAKDSFRFLCFWSFLAPETKGRAASFRDAPSALLGTRSLKMETEGARKLRKSAANPLK